MFYDSHALKVNQQESYVDTFITSSTVTEDDIEDFKHAFHKYVLENPSQENMSDQTIVDKAIAYYDGVGLKMRVASFTDGNNYIWYNINVNNSSVTYENCIM